MHKARLNLNRSWGIS